MYIYDKSCALSDVFNKFASKLFSLLPVHAICS